MIKILIIVYIISFYLSLPGFFSKAGYNSFGTLLFIFIPFMLADAYDKGKVIGFLCFLFPFIFYPLLAYFTGTYRYDMED